MATVTADSIAEAVRDLPLAELDRVVERLLALRAERRAHTLSQAEADLLLRIEATAPREALERRRALRGRTLGDDERAEFARLTEEIENAEAQRIVLLSQLAALRGVTLPEVARQLGIGPA